MQAHRTEDILPHLHWKTLVMTKHLEFTARSQQQVSPMLPSHEGVGRTVRQTALRVSAATVSTYRRARGGGEHPMQEQDYS
jgi:hypothetical protein